MQYVGFIQRLAIDKDLPVDDSNMVARVAQSPHDFTKFCLR